MNFLAKSSEVSYKGRGIKPDVTKPARKLNEMAYYEDLLSSSTIYISISPLFFAWTFPRWLQIK